MKPPKEEQEVARLLRELRRDDEASAPPFQNVLSRVQAPERSSRPRRMIGIACAALAALALAALLLVRRPERRVDLEAAAFTIMRWKAPTDSLLRTPGIEVFSSIPTLTQPAPDYSRLAEPAASRRTPLFTP